MAALQHRNGTWRILFQYNHKQCSVTVGEVSEAEARQWKAKAEHLLMRLSQSMIEMPRGVSIADFILHDGKPPVDPELARHKDTTLHQLREAYLKTFANGAIESNTLYTAGIHLDHIEETLGKKFILSGLTLGKLQDHVNRRAKDVSPVTSKKELDTFRSAWNWGFRMKWVDMPFPFKGLVYPKTDEKLPFMMWEEIQRRIKAGGAADELWECLYLRPEQTAELLVYVKAKKAPDFVYPMILAAAHTGARRSELIRAKIQDVDLANSVITINEKKRARGTRTTRRVPISKLLAEALADLMKRQEGKTYLFGNGPAPMSVQATHKALWRALKGSKWSVVKGWHTLRHSFISALASKGIDQRIIDDFVGHQTDEQRVRYRHLFPNVTQAAITGVFG